MKIKKLFKSILSTFIAVYILIPTEMMFLAKESTEGLYIITTECPQGAIEYARENLADFFVGYAEYTPDIKLGSPFALSSSELGTCTLYYFPVVKNNEIISTFRIYEVAQNKFAGILSPALAPELTALMQETSENSPARILVNNGNVVSIIGNDVNVICPDPMGEEVDYNEIAQMPVAMTAEVQNCMVAISHEPQSESASTYASYTPTYYLDAKIKEKQGKETWCMAYSLAFVLNYRKRVDNYNAKTIMRYFYPDVSDDDLIKKEIAPSDIVIYAANQNITLTEHRNQMGHPIELTDTALKTCIFNETPPILECQNVPDLKEFHAIVAKGYTTATFTIWDPRYEYFQTFPISTMIYTSPNLKTYEIFGYVA